ncbi:hypothetical protein BH09MYX1_BH09MYX1_11090 [soil metagenome]
MNRLSLIVLGGLFAGCSSDPQTPETTLDAGTDVVVVQDAAIDVATPKDAGVDAPASCTAAKETLLKPIDSISTGEVTILGDTGGVRTLFVDATAGGSQGAATNPRIYVDLATGQRVDVTDKTAHTSTAWDLAIKRPVFFTNGGDGGPGTGGAAFLDGKDFATVVAADATGKTFSPESFFESDCTPKLDATGAVKTSFDGWYDYDQQKNALSPHPGTFLVKGPTGKLYRLRIKGYYATADGGVGPSGGRYLLDVAPL